MFDAPRQSALFTDLYELTMAQAYHAEGMDQVASFELFFRKLPEGRNYLIAAGLEDVLAYLEHVQFTEDDLAFLRQQGQFNESFLDRLRDFRFTGDVDAMPEGTPIFPNEPLLRVTAPILQAQIIETLVINQIQFPTLVAGKASRSVTAAGGRIVVDFGSRRAHGADAALTVARASYLAGAAGTSNVLAGKLYDIPLFGTMAHSYIQAHDDEAQAFEVFARLYPKTTLLVDTYDTLEGVRKVIDLVQRSGDTIHVGAVRLDSGDLAELAKQTRQLLDAAGLTEVRIFASGSLDETKVARLLEDGAPIDGFGVGTRLAVTEDAPSLDMVYKLVEYGGRPRIKLSTDKVLYPGRKQVFRRVVNGQLAGDVIARHDETQEGEPLLRPMMRGGVRFWEGYVRLADARTCALHEVSRLPEELRRLEPAREPYPVAVSDILQRDLESLCRELGRPIP